MLTLRFVPYHEIEYLSSARRIHKLLELVKRKQDHSSRRKIKERRRERPDRNNYENIDEKFKGIELAIINPEKEKEKNLARNIKSQFMNVLLGDRQGLTVIGPATVVSEIKNNPDKLELYTTEESKKGKKVKKGKEPVKG